MRQRVMIAMALACDPQLIIADEITTALDVVTQAQVLKLMVDLQTSLNISIIFISHELSILAQTCNRIIIMYAGKIVEMGKTEDIFVKPQHPYTRWLLDSLPDIKAGKKKLAGIPGKPPNLITPPAGCRFNPRCPYKDAICLKDEPPLIHVGPKHYVACHRREYINETGKQNVHNS
jgi:oligopeptide/dipeptide ABC transporter ATP-binding protein